MTHRPILRWRGACTAVVLVAGSCASHNPPPVKTSILLEPARPDAAAPASNAATMPTLPVEQVAGSGGETRTVRDFVASDLDLPDVLRELATGFGLDFQIAPEVKGKVNVRLQSASLEDALRAIVRPHGFDYQLQGRVLYVGPPQISSELFTLDYVALSRVGQSSTVIQRRFGGTSGGAGGGGGSDAISSSSVADLWGEIRVALEAIIFGGAPQIVAFDSAGAPILANVGTAGQATGSPGGGSVGGAATAYSKTDGAGRKLVINPMAGTILVNAAAQTLAEVGSFLRVFEASVQRQVLIEAKIVEVQLNRNHEFGIDWSVLQRSGDFTSRVGAPGAISSGGLQFTLAGGAGEISAVLRSLSAQGDVRVLSSPQVSAINNQRAIFDVTTDEIIFTVNRQPVLGPNGGTIGFNNEIVTTQVAVGIVLDVFPQIGPDNTVSMNIRPAITNVARIETIRTEDGSEAHAPVIDRRAIDTFARVRPGETIVIGGLMQTRRERTRSGVPLLKDLPLLGYLFGRTTERETRGELVIFITPTIIAGQLSQGN